MPIPFDIPEFMIPMYALKAARDLRSKYGAKVSPLEKKPIYQVGSPDHFVNAPNKYNDVGGTGAFNTDVDALKAALPNTPVFDDGLSEDIINQRIGVGKKNLGLGTLSSLLPTLLQSSAADIPKKDDTFLDRMVRKVPQHIKDTQNAEIDRSARASINSVLSTTPLNKSSNLVNTLNNSAVNAKSNLAAQQGGQEIGLENQYLSQKQGSLDRYNASVAGASNEVRDNENTRLGNIGALGTNYFNEINNLTNNQNNLLDRSKIMKTQQYMQYMQMKELMKRFGK